MPVDGTSRLTRVQLAKVSVDFTKSPVEIQTTVALRDPTGATATTALFYCNGSVWSKDTRGAMLHFVACLEQDVASVVLSDGDLVGGSTFGKKQAMGLGEHLAGEDVPDL